MISKLIQYHERKKSRLKEIALIETENICKNTLYCSLKLSKRHSSRFMTLKDCILSSSVCRRKKPSTPIFSSTAPEL